MQYVLKEDQEKANDIAKKLNTIIPPIILILMWSLPMLEALLNRIEELEHKIK